MSGSASSPGHPSMSTTAAGGGSSSNAALSASDFQFPSDLISIQERKEEAMFVLKAELKAALDKEVKSLDEDNWKFEGPRSCINLTSKPSAFSMKRLEVAKNGDSVLPNDPKILKYIS